MCDARTDSFQRLPGLIQFFIFLQDEDTYNFDFYTADIYFSRRYVKIVKIHALDHFFVDDECCYRKTFEDDDFIQYGGGYVWQEGGTDCIPRSEHAHPKNKRQRGREGTIA